MYRNVDESVYRIVGFEVEPQSISMEAMTTSFKDGKTICALSSKGEPAPLELKIDCE